jgi:1,4-dihydroxy-2-naphthoyl-CoA hydrolase
MDKKTKIAGTNQFAQNSMASYLAIEVIDIEDDFIVATMPVNEKTIQPMGILHGGASVVLAETLGSIGSALKLDLNKQVPVGLEINANHIRSVLKGKTVTGKATIIHQGRKTHVWTIEIKDEADKLVCISRLTVAIVEKK